MSTFSYGMALPFVMVAIVLGLVFKEPDVGTMMLLAAVFASLSGVIGLYLSYYLSIASGAAIVLTATLFFLLAFVWKKFRER